MFLTIIGLAMVGVGAAILVFILFKLLRRPVPRGIMPLAAGIAMASYIVYQDYVWFRETSGDLPQGFVVAGSFTGTSPFKPWTYIVAPTERFVVVETAANRRKSELPGFVWTKIHLVARYSPTYTVEQIYDCVTPRRVDIGPNTVFGPDGLPPVNDWVKLEETDAPRKIACAG